MSHKSIEFELGHILIDENGVGFEFTFSTEEYNEETMEFKTGSFEICAEDNPELKEKFLDLFNTLWEISKEES